MVRGAEAAFAVKRIAESVKLPPKYWPSINYILGDPADNQYQSKSQKKRLLRAATVQARVNTIHVLDSNRAIQPIDDAISFPPINPSRVITPHHNTLVLNLCINDFEVHRVLVDPGSAADRYSCPPSGN